MDHEDFSEALRITYHSRETVALVANRVKRTANGKLDRDLLIDARTLSTEDVSGGNKKFSAVLYAAFFSPEGKMLGNQSLMLLHMDPNQPPGKSQLRMAVRDNRTGHTGSWRAPL
jgi:hypothetical protein